MAHPFSIGIIHLVDVNRDSRGQAISEMVHSTSPAWHIQWTQFDMIAPETITAIKVAGGRVLDPKPRFLDPASGRYIIQTGAVALYRDDFHLTTRGAKLMLLPLLRDSIKIRDRDANHNR